LLELVVHVLNISEQTHRRRNPLTGEWILVSPHRAKRPWQGQQEEPDTTLRPAYDPHCYLCANNQRVTGEHNPAYKNTYVFNNDFAALMALDAVSEGSAIQQDALFQTQAATGSCRVVCYSADHSKGMADLSVTDIGLVIETWQAQINELSVDHAWVQVFENKGAIMGCSNPHPHGQIWASHYVPHIVSTEDQHQRNYYAAHHSNLLLDYALREIADGTRIVVHTEHWLAVVPYWAAWPFETMLLPTAAISRMADMSSAQREDLALILKQLTSCYDRLFDCAFPYTMGWHYAPFSKDVSAHAKPHWQLHAHFYPPLLRSAAVRKFMVGFEMLCEPQRDLSPEQAAARLRDLVII
jgi:UDPglucose--hexose-1-phosphate uridylyltransferase